MQKINQNKLKSKKLLDEIKKDLKKLDKISELEGKNFQTIKETIEKIQNELNKFEDKTEVPKVEENINRISYVSAQVEEKSKQENLFDNEIRKKIIIKNPKQTKSFAGWLFNNKEL